MDTRFTTLAPRWRLEAPGRRQQALIGIAIFGLAIWSAWSLGNIILSGDNDRLILTLVGSAGLAIALAILVDWRFGTFLFFGWLLFEDLIRKYMGNNPALFFGKDILATLVYISLLASMRRGRERFFRPPFLLCFSLFFWLGVLQIFNPNSPSILYGLLGFKVYFYYVPLMWVGYAFIRSDDHLRRFLMWNLILIGIVASIGVTQSIVGNSFMNPRTLETDLQALGDLSKVTPISNLVFNIPPSVFVSAGRYAQCLIVAIVIALSTCGFLLLTTKKNRAVAYIAAGLVAVAAVLSGNRGAFVTVFATAVILALGFLWGAPWQQGEARRVLKAIRWAAGLIVLALVVFVTTFPKEAGSRIAYYEETLSPNSERFELSYRTWDYPIQNFLGAFADRHWVMGNGIGTISLGAQYVERLTRKPVLNSWVEEGFGELIIELGILGPILWAVWTAALLYYCWQVLRQLRGTVYFPLAFGMTWYAFFLLYPSTYQNLDVYQDYLCNAYFWLFVGILFRLPDLQMSRLAFQSQLASRKAKPAAEPALV